MEMLEIIHNNCRRVKEQRRLQEEVKNAEERNKKLEYKLEQEKGTKNNVILFSGLVMIFLLTLLGLALGF